MQGYYRFLNRCDITDGFREAKNGPFFVDKSLLIEEINKKISTKEKFVCVSRPRRFGKTMALEMLASYYTKEGAADSLFNNLKIKEIKTYKEHLNCHNVIYINFTDYFELGTVSEGIKNFTFNLLEDMKNKYSEIPSDDENLISVFDKIRQLYGDKFIFLIDEWDCVFRFHKGEKREQALFLSFLKHFFKDRNYVELVYMTGILPIKKYNTGSALNMFKEYTILNPGLTAPYFGFTDQEVTLLCENTAMDKIELGEWYGGYLLSGVGKMYNPCSVKDALEGKECSDYWNNTGGYTELEEYITMDFDGLIESVANLFTGKSEAVGVLGFLNDWDSFRSKNEILTALIHMGYLTYSNGKVSIPNKEVRIEFSKTIKKMSWATVPKLLKQSKDLLNAVLNQEEAKVAHMLEVVHDGMQEFKEYNNENTLKCVIHLAFYAALEDYDLNFEEKTGKGYADCIMYPKRLGNPGIILELKYNGTLEEAIDQIKDMDYSSALRNKVNRVYLVGINYKKDKKKHECRIEIMDFFKDTYKKGCDNEYLAHISSDKMREQTIVAHCHGTAHLAGYFASSFSCKEWGYGCGLVHDIGKYSEKFQKRLHGGSITDHATAGAQELYKRKNIYAAYCISGHHSGLLNGGTHADCAGEATFMGRMKKGLEDYHAYKKEIEIPDFPVPPLQPLGEFGFTASFFIRMLFSCLVDADYLDTEGFMAENPVPRGAYDTMSSLFQCVQDYIMPWLTNTDRNTVNGRRTEILKACLEKGKEPSGLFQLTVPTGGGKTVSSLAFALHHAIRHDKQHVIYVIPYTSIIEQNAAIFKDILGYENVLEDHCNVVFESEEELGRSQLAAENWDKPVIVTTNVQFFESLFSNKTSKCRKLHNIANSVIIFDEVQMLPVRYLQPCIRAITELIVNYRCSAVLCTATQPSLQPFFPGTMKCEEICPDVKGQYEFFRRTDIQEIGKISEEQLVALLKQETQVLCILNSRRQVQKIYEAVKEEGTYHLSTLMYPEHRKRLLREIRERLKEGKTCRLIATSLVEAGVDFDFQMVYRELAGIDSVIQAAGRCNREGKRRKDDCQTLVFTLEKSADIYLPPELKQPIVAAEQIAAKYNDIASLEAIQEYFKRLYYYKGEKGLDVKGIVEQLEKGGRSLLIPFADVADEFSLIEEGNTKTILIDQEIKAQEIVQRIRRGEHSRQLVREAGHYCIHIFEKDFENLNGAGKLEALDLKFYRLRNLEQYTDEMGLILNTERGEAVFL